MNKEFNTILWDIDDTLIDFKASEYIALKKCFEVYGIKLNDEQLNVYSSINHEYWKKLELGIMDKSTILVKRFDDFIEYLAVEGIEGKNINIEYQKAIGDYAILFNGAYEICEKLRDVKKQYAVTNGTLVAQELKLKNTGLDCLLDDVFISDVIGYQKPDARYFESVFSKIPNFDINKTLLIGDSLSSDIKGANNVGLTCCWYNPRHLINSDDSLKIDYEVQTFEEIMGIIK